MIRRPPRSTRTDTLFPYTTLFRSDEAYLCHCRMCQRATGGVSIAFKNVKRADVTWERAPDWYASSPFAKRPFCSACGAPLGFAFDEGSENMDLTIGSRSEERRVGKGCGSTCKTRWTP